MLDEIERLEELSRGIDFEAFRNSWLMRRAVERSVAIISEASRLIPLDLKELHPGIDWRAIAGIGNILRHDYASVSLDVIWTTLRRDLSPLALSLQEILRQLDTEAP